MSFENTLHRFLELDREMCRIKEMTALLTWDMRTGAPADGIPRRSKLIGALSAARLKIATGKEMKNCLNTLQADHNFEKLDRIQKALVWEARTELERYEKIPQAKYQDFVVLKTRSQIAWQEAKQKSDFEGFRTYLEQIVETNKQFAALWGYEKHPYDALLNWYEPGMTTERLDLIFQTLRVRIMDLLKRIKESGVTIDNGFLLQKKFDAEQQKKLVLKLLDAIGFNMKSGRMDQSEHPFTLAVSAPNDVRITTKYCPDHFSFTLLAALHEGGHGIYEQSIAPELEGTALAQGASEGIHESQSRLYENMLGKSKPFWRAFFGDVKKAFPENFAGVESDAFWRALNKVEPSLIRTGADELTYNLHIMVRYEIEKGLLDGSCRVRELPEIWREKMKEYLGVEPGNHAEGVLQDIHWAAGVFGYFPSYTLGNIYAAQFMHALEKELPDWSDSIAGGNVKPVTRWLSEKIHRYGKLLTPDEIIHNATGEPANPEYLMQYLEEKYTEIYNLKKVVRPNGQN